MSSRPFIPRRGRGRPFFVRGRGRGRGGRGRFFRPTFKPIYSARYYPSNIEGLVSLERSLDRSPSRSRSRSPRYSEAESSGRRPPTKEELQRIADSVSNNIIARSMHFEKKPLKSIRSSSRPAPYHHKKECFSSPQLERDREHYSPPSRDSSPDISRSRDPSPDRQDYDSHKASKEAHSRKESKESHSHKESRDSLKERKDVFKEGKDSRFYKELGESSSFKESKESLLKSLSKGGKDIHSHLLDLALKEKSKLGLDKVVASEPSSALKAIQGYSENGPSPSRDSARGEAGLKDLYDDLPPTRGPLFPISKSGSRKESIFNSVEEISSDIESFAQGDAKSIPGLDFDNIEDEDEFLYGESVDEAKSKDITEKASDSKPSLSKGKTLDDIEWKKLISGYSSPPSESRQPVKQKIKKKKLVDVSPPSSGRGSLPWSKLEEHSSKDTRKSRYDIFHKEQVASGRESPPFKGRRQSISPYRRKSSPDHYQERSPSISKMKEELYHLKKLLKKEKLAGNLSERKRRRSSSPEEYFHGRSRTPSPRGRRSISPSWNRGSPRRSPDFHGRHRSSYRGMDRSPLYWSPSPHRYSLSPRRRSPSVHSHRSTSSHGRWSRSPRGSLSPDRWAKPMSPPYRTDSLSEEQVTSDLYNLGLTYYGNASNASLPLTSSAVPEMHHAASTMQHVPVPELQHTLSGGQQISMPNMGISQMPSYQGQPIPPTPYYMQESGGMYASGYPPSTYGYSSEATSVNTTSTVNQSLQYKPQQQGSNLRSNLREIPISPMPVTSTVVQQSLKPVPVMSTPPISAPKNKITMNLKSPPVAEKSPSFKCESGESKVPQEEVDLYLSLVEQKEKQRETFVMLKEELVRLCRIQNEIMRRRQHDKDGHRDPLLLESGSLYEEVKKKVYEMNTTLADTSKKISGIRQKVKAEALEQKRKKKLLEEKEVHEETGVRFIYEDSKDHWCQLCKVSLPTLTDVFRHLLDPTHSMMVPPHERPWAEIDKKLPKPDKYTRTIATSVKGVQFLVGMHGYYCKLCKEMLGDSAMARNHLYSMEHNKNYTEFTLTNQYYERRWKIERDVGLAALAREEKKKAKEVKEEAPDIPLPSGMMSKQQKKIKAQKKREKWQRKTEELIKAEKDSQKNVRELVDEPTASNIKTEPQEKNKLITLKLLKEKEPKKQPMVIIGKAPCFRPSFLSGKIKQESLDFMLRKKSAPEILIPYGPNLPKEGDVAEGAPSVGDIQKAFAGNLPDANMPQVMKEGNEDKVKMEMNRSLPHVRVPLKLGTVPKAASVKAPIVPVNPLTKEEEEEFKLLGIDMYEMTPIAPIKPPPPFMNKPKEDSKIDETKPSDTKIEEESIALTESKDKSENKSHEDAEKSRKTESDDDGYEDDNNMGEMTMEVLDELNEADEHEDRNESPVPHDSDNDKHSTEKGERKESGKEEYQDNYFHMQVLDEIVEDDKDESNEGVTNEEDHVEKGESESHEDNDEPCSEEDIIVMDQA